jgi:hypothetical protein
MAQTKEIAQTGKIRPAKYLATGSLTEVEGAQSGGDGGVRIKGFKIGLGKTKAQVTMIVNLIDTTTGEIVSKKRIVGRPSGTKLRLGYAGADFAGFKKTPLGQAAQDAIAQAAKFFAVSMEEFPFEGSVIKTSDSGQVIVNRGIVHGMETGQSLVMQTEGEVLMDPDTGEVLDREEGEVIGKLNRAGVRRGRSWRRRRRRCLRRWGISVFRFPTRHRFAVSASPVRGLDSLPAPGCRCCRRGCPRGATNGWRHRAGRVGYGYIW